MMLLQLGLVEITVITFVMHAASCQTAQYVKCKIAV